MPHLLATKLHRPCLPPRRLEREQVLCRLNEGLESGRQITLVSAPAGFGKTVCVGEWIQSLERPVAWLSLDPPDDDPGRFFTYLIAALQQVEPKIGGEVYRILLAGQLPPREILASTLVNDLQSLEPHFLLVLDDFQVIQDRFILQVLEDLLEHLPPPLHLVLVTREEPSLPLARLRANNLLTEVRAADLRFTLVEAETFLNQAMQLRLSPGDVSALESRTEGWVVGLHLAGLSIRDREDPSAFIAGLSGSHRFIFDYLTEEVLARQPQEVQDFLLQTSILERLNGGLCEAVTGRVDSHLLLERLYAANLFLSPLNDEGHWYCYHRLFADLLRDRQAVLMKADLPARHRRASRWYAAAGMIDEAIRHALAAADYELAVSLIENHAMDMLMQWHVKTVDGWMQAIPPEWCARSPRANLAFAWLMLMRGSPEQAAPYLARLGGQFDASGQEKMEPSLQARWLALQSMLLNAQGRAQESLQLCGQALDILPPGDDQARIMIDLGLANACQQLGDYSRAGEVFQELIRLGRATGNAVSEFLGTSALGLLAIQHGQLHFAYDLASVAVERLERAGSLLPLCTSIYGELAVIHYQWHQLDQAHHLFQRAIQLGLLSGYPDAELFYSVILSRLFQIQGDLDAAARQIQKAVDLMKVQAAAVVREEVISQQVRIHLVEGDLLGAERALKGYGGPFKDGISISTVETRSIQPSQAVLLISALRILLYRARSERKPAELKPGIALADRLIDGALQGGFVPFALELLLVRARLHAALGDEFAGRADVLRALELGQPEGYISIFVEEGPAVAFVLDALLAEPGTGKVAPEYIRRIRSAFQLALPPAAPAASPSGPALLTGRELEVLCLMAAGMKYGEIAAKLVISLNTVRSHVKAIYAKLGVDNRSRAVEAGRRMHLF
jgi:LuxR family maltose regulon positive regulatory protein